MRGHLVVPSICGRNLERSAEWLEVFDKSEVDVTVVANSFDAREAELPKGVRIIAPDRNLGFAASVEVALRHQDPAFVVIANDDLIVTKAQANLILDEIARARSESDRWVRFFSDEHSRAIPTLESVLSNVSLVGDITRTLAGWRADHRERYFESRSHILTRGEYISFSFVAISGILWREVGGLSTDYPFCYEDADFCARAWESEGVEMIQRDFGLSHLHSESSSALVDQVLPVVVRSASVYLEGLGYSSWIVRLALLGSLVVRVPLTLFSSAPVRLHVRGIGRAMQWLLGLGSVPVLPYISGIKGGLA